MLLISRTLIKKLIKKKKQNHEMLFNLKSWHSIVDTFIEDFGCLYKRRGRREVVQVE